MALLNSSIAGIQCGLNAMAHHRETLGFLRRMEFMEGTGVRQHNSRTVAPQGIVASNACSAVRHSR
jgi:hypothetical protein